MTPQRNVLMFKEPSLIEKNQELSLSYFVAQLDILGGLFCLSSKLLQTVSFRTGRKIFTKSYIGVPLG